MKSPTESSTTMSRRPNSCSSSLSALLPPALLPPALLPPQSPLLFAGIQPHRRRRHGGSLGTRDPRILELGEISSKRSDLILYPLQLLQEGRHEGQVSMA